MKNTYIKILMILAFCIILTSIVSASTFYDTICSADGSLTFRLKSDKDERIYVNDIKILIVSPTGKIFDLSEKGEWSTIKRITTEDAGSLFRSEELLLNEEGIYRMEIKYKSFSSSDEYVQKGKEATFECPGLLFSCRLLDVSIDKCYNKDGKFVAEYTIQGLKPSNLKNAKVIDILDGVDYTIEATETYEDINNNIIRKGSLPRNYKLKEIGPNKYSLEAFFFDNEVKAFRVAFTERSDYRYHYDLHGCYTRETEGDLLNHLSAYEKCEVLESTDELPITGQAVKEGGNLAVRENSLLIAVIIGLALIAVLIIVLIVKIKRVSSSFR